MNETSCEPESGGGLVQVNNTLTAKLSRKREKLEGELNLIKKAQELLGRNPDLKELFDIVSQVRGI